MPRSYPLRNVTVLDLSQGVAGPHCGLLLAAYGADVIKVEPPAGDWLRRLGVAHGDCSSHFIAFNRGKRSVALDLRSEGGRASLMALAASADIVIENNRPGVSERLGLGDEALRAKNPDMIYVAVTGFGQAGPYRDRPGTDGVIQAYTGVIAANKGQDGRSHKLSYVAIDFNAGLYAFQATLMALYARRAGDGGAFLDISLTDSIAALLSAKYIEATLDGEAASKDMSCPCGTFETRDGVIYMVVMSEEQWPRLANAMELSELVSDPRFGSLVDRHRHSDALYDILNARFRELDLAAWCAILEQADLLHYPVKSYLDFLTDRHVQETGMFTWTNQPGVGSYPVPNIPGAPPLEADDDMLRAPNLDEHGAAVRELLTVGGAHWPARS